MSTPDALKQLARNYQRIMGATYMQALAEVSSTPTAIYGDVVWQPQRLLDADLPPNIYGPAKIVKNLVWSLQAGIKALGEGFEWKIVDCNAESDVDRRHLMASVGLEKHSNPIQIVVTVANPMTPTTIESDMICSIDRIMAAQRFKRRDYLRANLVAKKLEKVALDPVCFVGVVSLAEAAVFFRAYEVEQFRREPTLNITALGSTFSHVDWVRCIVDRHHYVEAIHDADPGSLVMMEPVTGFVTEWCDRETLEALRQAAQRGVRLVIGWLATQGMPDDRPTPSLETGVAESSLLLCSSSGGLRPTTLRANTRIPDPYGFAHDYAAATPTNLQSDDLYGLVKTSRDADYQWVILPHEPPAPIAELVDAVTADMVFVSGPTGCGKTVALRSFIQRARQQDPQLTILVLAEIPQALRLAPDDRIRYLETTQELTDILRSRYDGSKDVQPDPVMVVCDGLWGQSSPEHWETCLTYLSMHQPNGLPTLVVASQSRVSPSDLQSVERLSFDQVVFAGSSIVQGNFSPIGQDLLRQIAHSRMLGRAVLNPQSSEAKIVQVTYPE